MPEVIAEYNLLVEKLSNHMQNIKDDSVNIKNVLEHFVEYGLFLSNKGEELSSTVLLDFTTKNKRIASDMCTEFGHYFSILSSKLGYVYEDPDENECVLTEICRDRSGLEFFVEFFEARLREEDPNKFDDWYNVSAGIPRFDKLLTEKVKKTPILLKSRIPEGIPETHWWWQHPDDW